MVAAMVPSPDGKSLMTTGWSYASWGEARPYSPRIYSPQISPPLTPSHPHAMFHVHPLCTPLADAHPHACSQLRREVGELQISVSELSLQMRQQDCAAHLLQLLRLLHLTTVATPTAPTLHTMPTLLYSTV